MGPRVEGADAFISGTSGILPGLDGHREAVIESGLGPWLEALTSVEGKHVIPIGFNGAAEVGTSAYHGDKILALFLSIALQAKGICGQGNLTGALHICASHLLALPRSTSHRPHCLYLRPLRTNSHSPPTPNHPHPSFFNPHPSPRIPHPPPFTLDRTLQRSGEQRKPNGAAWRVAHSRAPFPVAIRAATCIASARLRHRARGLRVSGLRGRQYSRYRRACPFPR